MGQPAPLLAGLGLIVIALQAVGVVTEAFRRRGVAPSVVAWLMYGVVVCMLIVPQLVLYRGTSDFRIGRYLLPAALGVAVAFAGASTWLLLSAATQRYFSSPRPLGRTFICSHTV